MQIKSILAGASLVLGLAVVAPASANAQVGFVVQASYGLDVEEIGIGGGVNMAIGSLTEKHGLRFEGTFDYFLVEDPATFWEINGNLLKDIPSVSGLYVGAGINYAKAGVDLDALCGTFCAGFDSSDSQIGLNVLGGYKLGSGKAAPFVQARYSLGGSEQLTVTGGIRF